jgi:hypothetical protein
MKKITLLSIAAAVALTGTNAMAGDTHASGYAKAYYQSVVDGSNDILSQDSSAANIGVHIDVDHSITSKVKANIGISILDTANLEDDVVSGTIAGSSTHQTSLDVANIEVTPMDGTKITIGRMEYKSPLLNSDTWNMNKNTFEGVAVEHKLNGLNLKLAAFDKEHTRQDGTSFTEYDSTVYTAGLNAKQGTTEGEIHVYKDSDTTSLYVAGSTIAGGLHLSAQAIDINPENAVGSTIGLGLEVSAPIANGYGLIACSHISDGNAVVGKISDKGTKTPLYTQGVLTDADVVGAVNSDSIKVEYGQKVLGADSSVYFIKSTQDTTGETLDSYELGAKVNYSVSKDINVMALGAVIDHENGSEVGKDGLLRVVATYSF